MTEKRMLVIVPTRGRPQSVARLEQARRDTCTTGLVDFLYAVDDDDPAALDYVRTVHDQSVDPDCFTELAIGHRERLVGTLNTCARRAVAAGRWAYIGFMGDDHVPRTRGWDANILGALDHPYPRVVYGNDLLQGYRLATAVFMQARTVKALGFMAPPALLHLYADNFWMELGQGVAGLVYQDSTIIEHIHPAAGKTAMDDGYREANAPEVDSHDKVAWEDFRIQELGHFLRLVRQEYGMDVAA